MLPGLLLAALWTAIAVAWPVVQSLHALQLRSPERKLWLVYWLCYVACSWVPCYVEGIIRLPFYIIGALMADVYHEVRLLMVFYLVCPRFRGAERLQHMLIGQGPQLLGGLMEWVVPSLFSAAQNYPTRQATLGESSSEEDGPGTYTIIKEAGIMPTMETAKGHVVDHLNVGDVVEVVEVVDNTEEQRLRARIAASGVKPGGWISLRSRQTGTRWAVKGVQKPALLAGSSASEIFANAASAGCNPAALWMGAAATVPDSGVSDEDAWEAMAMLESQLSRADDASEGVAAQQAARMLKQMLTTLTQTGNPAMLGMAQAMMPDLAKIWANETTKAYLCELLSAQSRVSGELAAGAPAGSVSSSSSAAAGASSDVFGAKGAGFPGNATTLSAEATSSHATPASEASAGITSGSASAGSSVGAANSSGGGSSSSPAQGSA